MNIFRNIIFHMDKVFDVQRFWIHVEHYFTKVKFIALVCKAVVDKQRRIRFLPILVKKLFTLFDCASTLVDKCKVSLVVFYLG